MSGTNEFMDISRDAVVIIGDNSSQLNRVGRHINDRRTFPGATTNNNDNKKKNNEEKKKRCCSKCLGTKRRHRRRRPAVIINAQEFPEVVGKQSKAVSSPSKNSEEEEGISLKQSGDDNKQRTTDKDEQEEQQRADEQKRSDPKDKRCEYDEDDEMENVGRSLGLVVEIEEGPFTRLHKLKLPADKKKSKRRIATTTEKDEEHSSSSSSKSSSNGLPRILKSKCDYGRGFEHVGWSYGLIVDKEDGPFTVLHKLKYKSDPLKSASAEQQGREKVVSCDCTLDEEKRMIEDACDVLHRHDDELSTKDKINKNNRDQKSGQKYRSNMKKNKDDKIKKSTIYDKQHKQWEDCSEFCTCKTSRKVV